MKWIDNFSFPMLVIACLTLGLAPFAPEPHVLEKIKMLSAGTLNSMVDIGDLVMHGTPWLLLLIKAARTLLHKE